MSLSPSFDLIIIGAGAAGMMCAAKAGQAGFSVLLIDHAKRIGEKIRISGGGFCNFTNLNIDGFDASPFYVSENPRFVRYALSQYRAQDFIKLVEKYGIPYTEKHRGQLFCDREAKASARDIIEMLQKECEIGGVKWQIECSVTKISKPASQEEPFILESSHGEFRGKRLVIATGGLAIPKIGASDFGYRIAKQFGHSIIETRPALVPLQFDFWAQENFAELAGISLPVKVSTKVKKRTIEFEEDLLFRHKGLSGPAILQISSYQIPGQPIVIDLLPTTDLAEELCREKRGKRMQLDTALSELAPTFPKRLVQFWLEKAPFAQYAKHPWADIPDKVLTALGKSLNHWEITPSGTDGHRVAEATRGGVNTRELNPRTMESNLQKNLYFIGEVVDVVGWLGGYNFQWAWGSANCLVEGIKKAPLK